MKLLNRKKMFKAIPFLFLILATTSNALGIDNSSINFNPYAIFNNNISNSTIEIDTGTMDVETITIQFLVYSDPIPVDFEFTAIGYDVPTNQFQLFDDGTHGDAQADDHIYTIGGVKTDISELPERGFIRLWAKVSINGLETDIYYPCFFIVEEEPFLYLENDNYVLSNYMVNYYSLSSTVEDQLHEITNLFYKSFDDEFNFLFVYQEYRPSALTGYLSVKNDVSGIGANFRDNTSFFGSDGKLEGIIRISTTSQIIMVPNTTVFHEIGHRWSAYLSDPELELSTGVHWKNNTTIVGMMNECCNPFVYNGDGTFTHFCRIYFTKYSPLELYLMGAISPEELDTSMDLYILDDPDINETINNHIPCGSIVEPENYVKITSSDIINVYGTRDPNCLSASKHFRAAAMMITKQKMTMEEVTVVNKILRHYSEAYNPDYINGEDWYLVPSFANYTDDKLSLDYAIIQELSDLDNDGLPDELEEGYCTDLFNADTDDDGINDGVEDANHNGVVDAGETHPCYIDTDNDGIQDGTELGYTLGDVGPDTDTNVFQPDLDDTTTTDPLDEDSDNDGLLDGQEDANHNGRVDQGETNPNQRKGKAMPWIPLLLLDD